MAVFGGLAVLMGVTGLVAPDILLGTLGFSEVPADGAAVDQAGVLLAASSMASFNMGVYYLLAAAADWRPFFRWTVPFRLLTCTVFTLLVVVGKAPGAFVTVGLWEGLGAVVTGAALRRESVAARRAVV
ncbi:hypothetical protein [Streptomyces sp. TP-A0874]|uniref:hypothetical protein n=1 Tax=Streptomyces sp. TP-A0874 TaxID=549819 RepID=UPI001BAED669|nr:hypothetical protein [Streptomyces sp. TP-A0874]